MFLLNDDQQVEVGFTTVDDVGNPTTLPTDAAVVWSASDPSVLAVTANASDSTKAEVVTTGKLGTSQVNVAVTLAGAAAPLTAAFDVQVVPSATTGVAITPTGSPVSRLPAAPPATPAS